MAKIKDIIAAIEEFAPLYLQADYDNSGLIYGFPDRELKKAIITLDVTEGVVLEAVENGANMIITHHPVIFNPIKRLDVAYPYISALTQAVKNEITVYAAHTNIDFADGGLNDMYMKKLLAESFEYLIPEDKASGRIGALKEPIKFKDYFRKLTEVFGVPIAFSGDTELNVKTIAAINGAGGGHEDTVMTARARGADIFITSELKYNVVRLAKELNYAIIEIGHYDSEKDFGVLIKELLEKKGFCGSAFITTRLQSPYGCIKEL